MDSKTFQYETVDSREAQVVFTHEVVDSLGRTFEEIDSRTGGQWLPMKSRVIALVDFEHGRVVFLNGASASYPYGREMYRQVYKGTRMDRHGLEYTLVSSLKEYIEFLWKEENEVLYYAVSNRDGFDVGAVLTDGTNVGIPPDGIEFVQDERPQPLCDECGGVPIGTNGTCICT